MNQTIKVTFKQGGSFTIEAIGFQSGACLAATRPFEEALGASDLARDLKPEAMQSEITTEGHVDVSGT